MTVQELARLIDHTILKPTSTPADVERVCEEARRYGFASVATSPWAIPLAVRFLAGSGVLAGAAIGFPLGTTTSAVKAAETAEAVQAGAGEVDMVIHLGYLKAGDHAYVYRDIRGVVKAAEGRVVKVIIECCYLTDEEKVLASRLAEDAGAQFVKTSTGFGPSGATPEDVRLIRAAVGPGIGVKAAGGIRTLEQVERLLAAGATRIGTSSGVSILRELEVRGTATGSEA